MCITPITLKKHFRSRKDSDKKNGSGLAHRVPCGKCIKCLKRRQNAWQFRLQQESKISTSSCFITLTYATPPLTFNGLPSLQKKDFQNFIKRLRKKHSSSSQSASIKYYACGEYGTETKRPHYHAIMFNLPQKWIQDSAVLHDTWNEGHIVIAPCNNSTISYVTKYLLKGGNEHSQIDYDDRQKEFSLMSKKMGLNHLTPQMKRHYKTNLKSHVTLAGGTPTAMPRYFRDKIFNKEEKNLIAEAAEQARETNFQKLFDNSFIKYNTWQKDKIRIQEKNARLERAKI